jgi:hypothetical protein
MAAPESNTVTLVHSSLPKLCILNKATTGQHFIQVAIHGDNIRTLRSCLKLGSSSLFAGHVTDHHVIYTASADALTI